MTILVGMMPLEVTLPLARLLTVSWAELESNALQGARHAVLRTLCSRAHRVGLDEASWALRSLSEDSSFGLLMVAIAALLV